MKYALVIPDGCADEPQQRLGGRTPLEAARLPAMDRVAAEGIVGRAVHVPASMPSGSDVGTMSLLGYDPLSVHTGRAPIEAAARGIPLGDDDWAVRCNLVTVEDGVMRSFTGGQVPSELGAALLESLAREVSDHPAWEWHPGVSYRNLAVLRPADSRAPFSESTVTVPPHDLIDQPVDDYRPTGDGAPLLRELMSRSQIVFADHPGNIERIGRGEPAVTQIWLWGQGKRPSLVPFRERFGIDGAVITAVDLLRGIASLIGWRAVAVEGATGYSDTDFAAKGQVAIETLDREDIVVVHVEATDEASHEGDVGAKVAALEAIDRDIVEPLHRSLAARGEYRLLVCPDHPTFLRTRTHAHGPVPFAVCGTGIEADRSDRFDERAAGDSQLEFARGHELMPMFIGEGAS